jgi:hypothetical protein
VKVSARAQKLQARAVGVAARLAGELKRCEQTAFTRIGPTHGEMGNTTLGKVEPGDENRPFNTDSVELQTVYLKYNELLKAAAKYSRGHARLLTH